MKVKKATPSIFNVSSKKLEPKRNKVQKVTNVKSKINSSKTLNKKGLSKEKINLILNNADLNIKQRKNEKLKKGLEGKEKNVHSSTLSSVTDFKLNKSKPSLKSLKKNKPKAHTLKDYNLQKESSKIAPEKVTSKKGHDVITKKHLNLKKVTTAVNGLLKLVEGKKADLLDLAEPIFVQVESIKIPTCRTKQLHFKLPHPLINELSDILLITTDLKGAKIYPDKAIDRYTELLVQHGINFIQKVIPLRSLTQEYSQYETRRKLVAQYDMILADKRAIKSLPSRLGSFILYNHKMPISVDLTRKNLKAHLQTALSKTQMTVKGTGHLTSVQVGHTKMAAGEVAANIVSVAWELDSLFPGGWANVRSLNIKTSKSVALPVYLSLVSPNAVQTPVEKIIEPEPVVGELSTKLYSNVEVKADGTVTVIEADEPIPLPIDNSHDDEILQEAREYKKSAKTIHYDHDDNKGKESGELVTDTMEKKMLENYAKSKKGDSDNEEDDQEEESSDEDEPIGKKRKPRHSKNKSLEAASPGGKMKKRQHLDKPKEKTKKKGEKSESTKKDGVQVQRRGSRGGKKKKLNKVQRKALIKRKKGGS